MEITITKLIYSCSREKLLKLKLKCEESVGPTLVGNSTSAGLVD